ncbi:MAG: ADP-ribosylglycohydrolase family protein [Hydrogenobaculum sp.]|jgi:ADP-ribosylglycohydrolase
MKEKFRGIALGSAIGDAIGKSFEDLDIYQVEEFYRDLPITNFVEPHPSSPAFFQKPNETSDETTVAKLLIESILESKKLDIYNYFDKLKAWAFDETTHRYPDPFILKAIYNLSNNIIEGLRFSSVEGILRVIATSMLHFENEALSEEAAKLVTMLTHRSDEALDGAILFNRFLVKSIKNDESLETLENRIELLKELKSCVKSFYTKKMLDILIDALEEGYSKEKAIVNIGNGNFVLESLGLSLYYFLTEGIEYPFDTFVSAINSYWEFGGDTDAIGFITGALLGAYHGYEFLPEDLIQNLENHQYYIYLADNLYELSKRLHAK